MELMPDEFDPREVNPQVYARVMYLQPLDSNGNPSGLPKRIPGANLMVGTNFFVQAQYAATDAELTNRLFERPISTLPKLPVKMSWETRLAVDEMIKLQEWVTNMEGYQASLDSWTNEGGACV